MSFSWKLFGLQKKETKYVSKMHIFTLWFLLNNEQDHQSFWSLGCINQNKGFNNLVGKVIYYSDKKKAMLIVFLNISIYTCDFWYFLIIYPNKFFRTCHMLYFLPMRASDFFHLCLQRTMIQNKLFLLAFVDVQATYFYYPSKFNLNLLNITTRQYLNMPHAFLGLL